MDEDAKKRWEDVLEDIYPECHDCKYLFEDCIVNDDYEEWEILICDKDQLIFMDEDFPRGPCGFRVVDD